MRRILAIALFALWAGSSLLADGQPLVPAAVRTAVERALPLLQKSAAEYSHQRTCFSCHHQGVSTLAVTFARERGFRIDSAGLGEQLNFTAASLRQGLDGYRRGEGQGGGTDTAGYALWTLQAGGRKGDETTTAVSEFLLRRDAGEGAWRPSSNRPPSEASLFTPTFLAVRGLHAFGPPEQRERIEARVAKAREWLLKTPARDTEDRVFRLWGLKEAGAGAEAVRSAADELLAKQRPDGGWAQTPDMASDAYATGSALVALRQAGGLTATDPACQRGVSFLTSTQLADGSWHVATRSRPIQVYFESGFPHGKDQFISMAATAWAVAALSLKP